ncbi:phosphoribosylamine--glycine ligase, partial [Candidatus Woesearchaeota archaeon]|nr:phosphoribosylamine--glycine ligase [Candidatus Woesearchaeota archaeon]
REHALAWKIAQSEHVGKVYVGSGNPGIAREDKCMAVPLKAGDFREVSDIVMYYDIGLTVVGPEAPLADGIVDYFHNNSLAEKGHFIFGPSKGAASLESSKVFAKKFMKKYGIPTADFHIHSSIKHARGSARDMLSVDDKVVVKADGLAAGKGAIVCDSYESAKDAIDMIMKQKKFGDAGNQVVVERFMPGEEASILALSDGFSLKYLISSQDHKAVYDGDRGPNTGGMGAYAAAPVVTDEVMKRVISRIAEPTIEGMAENGTPFEGCLYMGLMIDKDGNPRVVEYNIRFGDPETQPVLMMLESDIYPLLRACPAGNLSTYDVQNKDGAACCVVMANEGYPGSYEKGALIHGIEDADALEGVKVFHAGTGLNGEGVTAAGGRVLGVTAVGPTIEDAVGKAYAGVNKIHWDGEYHRNDIGHRAMERE